MIHFLYICVAITDVIKWFSSRVAVCILQIFILVLIIDAYIFEIETAHFVSSFALDLLYPYLDYFLKLRLPIVCMLFYLF